MTTNALSDLAAVAARDLDEARARAMMAAVVRAVVGAAERGERWAEEVLACASETIERGGDGSASEVSDGSKSSSSSAELGLLRRSRAKRRSGKLTDVSRS